MKSKSEQQDTHQHWIPNKKKLRASRELVYKLIDINQDINSEGKMFRVGGRVYFVRELG